MSKQSKTGAKAKAAADKAGKAKAPVKVFVRFERNVRKLAVKNARKAKNRIEREARNVA